MDGLVVHRHDAGPSGPALDIHQIQFTETRHHQIKDTDRNGLSGCRHTTDIYALSADYDRNAPLTNAFFATVQNMLHWAITGKIAAEIIYASADVTKIYMGLTTWKHVPDGIALKSESY
jgi:hypothetical protein